MKVVKITITLIIAFISILILIFMNLFNPVKLNIYGWEDFKKGAIENYTFVNRVGVFRITPPTIEIGYDINRKLDKKEIDDIFNYTKEYILSEKTFADLKKFHKERFDYSFSEIMISLQDYRLNDIYTIRIWSCQNESGEAENSYFDEWEIQYNDGTTTYYNVNE